MQQQPMQQVVYAQQPGFVQQPGVVYQQQPGFVQQPGVVYQQQPGVGLGGLPGAPLNTSQPLHIKPGNKEEKSEEKSLKKAESFFAKAEKAFAKGDTKSGQKYEKKANDYKASAKAHRENIRKDEEALARIAIQKDHVANHYYTPPPEKKTGKAGAKGGAKAADKAVAEEGKAKEKSAESDKKAAEGKPAAAEAKAVSADVHADKAKEEANRANASGVNTQAPAQHQNLTSQPNHATNQIPNQISNPTSNETNNLPSLSKTQPDSGHGTGVQNNIPAANNSYQPPTLINSGSAPHAPTSGLVGTSGLTPADQLFAAHHGAPQASYTTGNTYVNPQ